MPKTAERKEIIDRFIEEILDGGSGKLLDDYCEKYPFLRGALEQKYELVKVLDEAFADVDLSGTEIGEYLIVDEIGRGGMGVVYLALQRSLNRYVALKVLPFALSSDSGAVNRFRSEARIVAKFNHPNIVPVHFMGEEKGLCYIAMALVTGISFDKVLQALRCAPASRRSAMMVREIISDHPDFMRLNVGSDETGEPESIHVARPPSLWVKPYHAFVLTLCAEIADALSYAHKNGICHGDLKPSNIMLTRGGVPMIVDFGLAKDMRSLKKSQSQDFLGTISYASPEHITKNIASPASEVWSLGVTMYEMLSLKSPFQAVDVARTIENILKKDPPLLRTAVKAFPKDAEAIVFKCMEKTPEARYHRVDLVKEDLSDFLLSKPVVAKPVGNLGRLTRWTKRNRVVSILTCALLLLLTIGSFLGFNSLVKDYIVQGQNYVNNGKYPEAVRSYEKALALLKVPLFSRNTEASALSGTGDAWAGSGQFKKAIAFYERALRIEADNAQAVEGIGDVYYDEGHYARAVAWYNRAIILSPGDSQKYYSRGRA